MTATATATNGTGAASVGSGVFVLTYGDFGVGKTTEAGRTLPRALAICRPGGMLPVKHALGIAITEVYARTLGEVAGYVEATRAAGYWGVIADDLSLAAEADEVALDKALGRSGGAVYARFDALRARTLALRDAVRWSGMVGIGICHERVPGKDAKGRQHKGGPKMASWSTGEAIPYDADLVLRARLDPTRVGWPGVYECHADPDNWSYKDRFDAAPVRGPMNLRAILRAAGYTLPRAAGLEWQDAVALRVRERVALQGDPVEVVVREAFTALATQGRDVRHVRWAVADGLAYAEVEAANKDRALQSLLSPARAVVAAAAAVAADSFNNGAANSAAGGGAASGVTFSDGTSSSFSTSPPAESVAAASAIPQASATSATS